MCACARVQGIKGDSGPSGPVGVKGEPVLRMQKQIHIFFNVRQYLLFTCKHYFQGLPRIAGLPRTAGMYETASWACLFPPLSPLKRLLQQSCCLVSSGSPGCSWQNWKRRRPWAQRRKGLGEIAQFAFKWVTSRVDYRLINRATTALKVPRDKRDRQDHRAPRD